MPGSKASAGIGEVVAVERAASRIKELEAAIERSKSELVELEEVWKQNLHKLRQELTDLYEYRDAIIRDLKAGVRCSKCKMTKAQFQKEGKDFEAHIAEVKAVAIPAPESEIEAVREEFKSKISAKKREIERLEEGDARVLANRRSITDSKNKIETLCREITANSKAYERAIAGEVKQRHNSWVKDLMEYASRIFVEGDKTVIYTARIAAYQKEFAQKAIEVREEVKKENAEEQAKRRSKILQNEQELQTLEQSYKEHIGPLETKLSEIKLKIDELNSKLERTDLPDDVKNSSKEERAQFIAEAAAIEKDIRDYKSIYESRVSLLQNETTQLRLEVAQLFTGLAKQQDDAVAALKVTFDQKISEAEKTIATAETTLSHLRTAYNERVEFYSKNNDEYYKIVSSESDRMVIAGKEVNCSVWNQARGLIARNWNDVLPCVNTMTTMAKPYSTHVFGSYCPSVTSPSNLFIYKNFLLSLDDDDRKVIKASSNADWFESLFE